MRYPDPPAQHPATASLVRKVPHRVLLIFLLLCLLLTASGIGIGIIVGRRLLLANDTYSQLCIGTFCLGALAWVLAWRAMRLVFQPIDAVTEAAFALAQGNLDQVAAVDSRDNFGQLRRLSTLWQLACDKIGQITCVNSVGCDRPV